MLVATLTSLSTNLFLIHYQWYQIKLKLFRIMRKEDNGDVIDDNTSHFRLVGDEYEIALTIMTILAESISSEDVIPSSSLTQQKTCIEIK